MNEQRTISAIFRDRLEASRAYDWLRSRGYQPDLISVMMSDQTRRFFHENKHDCIKAGTMAAEGVAAGGAIGTAIGATIAAIAAIGTTSLILPGLGLVVAGPVAAAFAGGGAGAVAGGVIGGLIGLGIPESNAKAYEDALLNGGVAIAVRPFNEEDAQVIRKEFEGLNGDNIITIEPA
jgi:hypothetical protein